MTSAVSIEDTHRVSAKNAEVTGSRRKRFERAIASDHPLTPLKLRALQLVGESKFLSTPQVAALGGWSERAARAHLRDLYDMGLLDVLAVPGAAVGSNALIAPKVHLPTKEGLRTLEKCGMLPTTATKPVSYAPSKLGYLGHELAVRDVLIWLTRSARRNTDSDHQVEVWDCSAGLSIPGANTDAIFTYKFEPREDGRTVSGMVEVDMGTERGTAGNRHDRWAAKLAAYSVAFEEEDREMVFQVTGVRRARLVVTVPTQERANWILRRAEGTSAATFLWIAVRADLESADVYTPAWYRSEGAKHAFVPAT